MLLRAPAPRTPTLVADLNPLLAVAQRDPVKFAALDASPRGVADQRLGDPRHLRVYTMKDGELGFDSTIKANADN